MLFSSWFKKRKKARKITLAHFCGRINHAELVEGGQLSAGPIFNMTAYDELAKDHVELTSLNRGPFRNAFMELTNEIKRKNKRVVIEVMMEDE